MGKCFGVMGFNRNHPTHQRRKCSYFRYDTTHDIAKHCRVGDSQGEMLLMQSIEVESSGFLRLLLLEIGSDQEQ